MPDVTLAAKATQAAPLDYPIPAAAELVLKALTADFDGTGAGGSFVPSVQILLPNNVVVGTFPLGQTIAAGASADVSWFPGVTPKTTAAAAATISYANVDAGTTSVTSGVQKAFDLNANPIVTNNPTTFTLDVNTDGGFMNGLHGLGIHVAGWFLITFSIGGSRTAFANPYTKVLDMTFQGNAGTVNFVGGSNWTGAQDTPGVDDGSGNGLWAMNLTQLVQTTGSTGVTPINVSASHAIGVAMTCSASISAMQVA